MDLGTSLAVVAFAQQCLNLGKNLVDGCKAYHNAETEVREALVTIEYIWRKTEAQIQFLKDIAGSLDDGYLSMQSHILARLESKLKKAIVTVGKITREKSVQQRSRTELDLAERVRVAMSLRASAKLWYAWEKRALLAVVHDLEKWQACFDPSWMLIMRIHADSIDQQLSREMAKPPHAQRDIILTGKALRDAARLTADAASLQTIWLAAAAFLPAEDVPLPPLALVTPPHGGSPVLIDTMHCLPVADIPRTTRDVCKLARILQNVDAATFGLLRCRGIIRGREAVYNADHEKAAPLPTFSFVFDVAPGLAAPRSLRTILLEAAPWPLDARLALARRLAASVLYVHTASFVHKNIRPEMIVVFATAQSPLAAPFLCGFDKFRPEDGHTYSVGDGHWEANLYRYPTRQGVLPEQVYNMQHDIYSLGVVLLEIGLWQSFVDYTPPLLPSDRRHDAWSDAVTSLTGPAVPSATPIPTGVIPALEIGDGAATERPSRRAFRNKARLHALAADLLPARMGSRYAAVVGACLACLDDGGGFGDAADLMDRDGVVVGQRFIEVVLERMEEICL